MFDKFHDECGVFAVLNHENAANIVYLGLYALQHRGQESAGIASVSSDRRRSETNIGEASGASSGFRRLSFARTSPIRPRSHPTAGAARRTGLAALRARRRTR